MTTKGTHLSTRSIAGSLRGYLDASCYLWYLVAFCLSLNCGLSCAEATPTAITPVAAAAAAAAAVLLSPPVESKKVLGIARGANFEAIGDFCFTVPPGSRGALMVETMLHEEGHELLIHPKSAAVEYEAATAAAGVPLDAAGEATLAATCRAIRKNSIVRQSLAGSPSESQLSTGMPSFFELNLAIDSSLDGSDVTAWITRCDEGKQLNAAYSATFLNPGSFFYRQFSCQDQGLLPLYMVLSLFALAICLSALAVGLAVAALLSMLGASVTPDELNPAALYTTLRVSSLPYPLLSPFCFDLVDAQLVPGGRDALCGAALPLQVTKDSAAAHADKQGKERRSVEPMEGSALEYAGLRTGILAAAIVAARSNWLGQVEAASLMPKGLKAEGGSQGVMLGLRACCNNFDNRLEECRLTHGELKALQAHARFRWGKICEEI
ncbi:uncharacterized protein LOC34617479 [Cyclospora cayetanensis]|uniref:Uncharacterized protein LOC34617479 n=1 Tax=Cyclospora cayetanensis TaxID=88456 RepID=A0A6P6RYD2_9EIME|nr:uncharacterized protein LOC34617479 [Cyclospora cayetanensis]